MATEDAYLASLGGQVRSQELIFKVGPTTAGAYSASVVIPAGAHLLDILVEGVTLWDSGTSATMIFGDAADDDGYYTAVNLKATDLLAGESISFALAGGKAGAYIANSQVSPRYSSSTRTIAGKVTTVGTSTAGETRAVVIWCQPGPATRTDATFA